MSSYPQTLNSRDDLRNNRFVMAFAEGYADGIGDGIEGANYYDADEELRTAYLDGFNRGVTVYCGTIDGDVEPVRDYHGTSGERDKDWYEKNTWLKAQGVKP